MSVNLNKWSKMNVNLAKAPFTWKTRTAIMTHLATTLDCTEQVLNIRGDSEKWKGKMKMYQIQQVHYLKQKIRTRYGIDHALYTEASYLEVLIHIGLIFNDCLTNSSNQIYGIKRIDSDNIDEVASNFKILYKYFYNGMETARKRKCEKDVNNNLLFPGKSWELTWFSTTTTTNLRILMSGCVSVSRKILNNNNGITYLPMLVFNQSNLEAQFSCARRLKPLVRRG